MIEDDTRIIIGDNNRFSNEVDVRCTDDHCVLDENGNVLNRAESIIIGNDNWITRGVTILKNTVLLNESAIGTRSVFTKKMDRSNVVVAGNPARVVRENIKLDDERPDFYAYKHADQDRKGVDMFARQYSDVGYFAQNSTTSCKKNMSETSNIPKLNIKFLGIPVLRKKTKNNKVKYYVLGIHLLTVKIR
jgi:carbonic anhydrase/acetyltransferase-like protein (isoleucine patch superfamily)